MAIADRIAFAREHFERLQKGAKLTGLKIPVNRETLLQWLTKTAARHPAKVKRLRLTITSGDSPVWRQKPGKPRIICSAIGHKFDRSPQRLYVPQFRVDSDSSFNQIKTIAYGLRAAALREAQTNKCEDALLLNNLGNVSEMTSANIFWVKGGRIFTPPITAGCLEGVTRRVILEQGKIQNWGIVEKNCTLKELTSADEVFSTSSVRITRPVGEIRTRDLKLKIKPGGTWSKIFEHLAKMLALKI
jgi:branched-subunit amino acid aminotransferase/4-amino-4-deoxychorismate lyase